jgi:hypothetical protein
MVICRVWSTLFYGLPKVEIILKPELSPSHSAADDRQLFAVLGRRGLTPKDGLTVYLRSEFSDRNTPYSMTSAIIAASAGDSQKSFFFWFIHC